MTDIYNLFEKIKDEGLRARNRGVMLANIYEESMVNGKIPPSGMKNLLVYFQAIPLEGEQRERAYAEFQVQMHERKHLKEA